MDINEYLQKFKMVEKLKQYDEIFCNYFYSDHSPFPRTKRYSKPKEGICRYERLEYEGNILNRETLNLEKADCSYYIIDYFWHSFAPVDIALFFASMGYRVLPTNGILPPTEYYIEKYKDKKTDIELNYNWSKTPYSTIDFSNGSKCATTDPDSIIRWFSGGATSIGVVGGDKVMFFDVDNKNGYYGFDDIEWLRNYLPAPDTFTPLNGCHITLKAPENYYAIKNTKLKTAFILNESPSGLKKRYGKGKNIPRMGVDVRVGDSTYIICPGSIVHSPFKLGEVVRYKGFLLPPELYPKLDGSLCKLLDYGKYQNVPKDNEYHGTEKEAIEKLSQRPNVSQKIFYACRNEVMNMPESIDGNNGHSAMFAVVCNIFKDWGLNYEQGILILDEFNENRAKPMWDYDEIKHKIKDAYEKCLNEGDKVGYKTMNMSFMGSPNGRQNHFTNYTIKEELNDMDDIQNDVNENNVIQSNVSAQSQNNNSSNTEADENIGEEIKDVKKLTYRNIDPQPFFDAFNDIPEVSLYGAEKARLRKSPVGLFYLSFLNGFSSLLGNYYAVEVGKDWVVSGGGFNVLNLGDSGVGKSSTAGKAIEPLWKLQGEIFRKEIRLFHSKEEKEEYDKNKNTDINLPLPKNEEKEVDENKQKDKTDKYVDDGEPPLFMGSNHTYERVCLELADHKRFFWYWDEYMGLAKKMCPGGIDNGNVNSLNTLCERGVVDYGTKQAKDLKGRKTGYAENVVITLGGNSTIDDFTMARQVQPLWNSGHFNRYAIGVFFSEREDDTHKSIEELALEEVDDEDESNADEYWKNYNGFMRTAFHNLYRNKYFDTEPTAFTMKKEARIELKKYEIICRRRGLDLTKDKAAFAKRQVHKAVQIALIIHLSKLVRKLNGVDNDDREDFFESLVAKNCYITTDEIKQAVAIAEYIWESFLLYLRLRSNKGVVTGLSPIAEYIYNQMTAREEANKGKEYRGMTIADIKNCTEFRATIKAGRKTRQGLHYRDGRGNTHIVSALQELFNCKLAQTYSEDDGKQYWRLSGYISDTQE